MWEMPSRTDMDDRDQSGEGPSNSVILEGRNIQVVYHSGERAVAAVEDFSIRIREGEFVGLVGESGCGKSTAALALLGLVRPPGKVVQGMVLYRGEDLLRKLESQLRMIRGSDIGLVVQNPNSALNPLLTIGTQIANVYRDHHPVSKSVALKRVASVLKGMGIDDVRRWMNSYPHQLSGGMAQRVLIAMATINEPKLLVADEPTTGLDVTVQGQILDLIQSRVQETGSAVLLVTHDLGIVAHYCDRVVVMLSGRIIEEAQVQVLFSMPRHPYTKKLVASSLEQARATHHIPTAGFHRPQPP